MELMPSLIKSWFDFPIQGVERNSMCATSGGGAVRLLLDRSSLRAGREKSLPKFKYRIP